MKKVINGKRYDTETARVINEEPYSFTVGFYTSHNTLMCKRSGEYFIYSRNKAEISKMSEDIIRAKAKSLAKSLGIAPNADGTYTIPNDGVIEGEDITPVSYELAREWALRNLSEELYEKEFGDSEESDNDVSITVSVSISAALFKRVRRKAQKEGRSISNLIQEFTEAGMKDND